MVALFDEKVKTVLINLLNKAGRDPRLTPRLLREKAEQKLNIEKGCVNYFIIEESSTI